jgi:hypothetical protein
MIKSTVRNATRVVILVLASALALAACSSSSKSTSSTTSTTGTSSTTNKALTTKANLAAQATLQGSATKTAAAGGVNLALNFSITNPPTKGTHASTAIAGSMSGTYNMSVNEGNLTVAITTPQTIAQLIGGPLHLSILNGNAYFIPPSTLANTLGTSTGQYAEVPLSTLSTLLQLGQLGGSIINPSGLFNLFNTKAMLVTDLGQVTINGVPTTHYTTSVNLNTAIADGGPAKGIYQALKSTSPKETNATSQVWIGTSNDRLRQVSLSISDLPSGLVWNKGATMNITLDITQFGIPVNITPPPPSQVKQVTI